MFALPEEIKKYKYKIFLIKILSSVNCPPLHVREGDGRELTNRQMMFALTEEIFSRNFNENASRQLLFRQVIELSSHQDKKSASPPPQGLGKLKPDFGSPSSHTYVGLSVIQWVIKLTTASAALP